MKDEHVQHEGMLGGREEFVDVLSYFLSSSMNLEFVVSREMRGDARLDEVEKSAQHAQMLLVVVHAEQVLAVDFGEVEPMVCDHLARSSQRRTFEWSDARRRKNVLISNLFDVQRVGQRHVPILDQLTHVVDLVRRSNPLASRPRIVCRRICRLDCVKVLTRLIEVVGAAVVCL